MALRRGEIDSLSDFSARGLHELRMWMEVWFRTRNVKPGGGGDGGVSNLIAFWGGTLPLVIGPHLVWRIPYDADGTARTYTFTRAFARMENTYASTISFRLEKSAPGGVFSATTITTVNITAGNYQAENTGLSFAASSGDLLRMSFTAVGIVTPFQVELVGSHP